MAAGTIIHALAPLQVGGQAELAACRPLPNPGAEGSAGLGGGSLPTRTHLAWDGSRVRATETDSSQKWSHYSGEK